MRNSAQKRFVHAILHWLPLGPAMALSVAAIGLCAEPVSIQEVQARKSALTKLEPEYPPMARQMKVAGRVQLVASVDIEGNVTKTEVSEGHAILGSACAAAVKKWKFKPFVADGKAVPALVHLSFDFRM